VLLGFATCVDLAAWALPLIASGILVPDADLVAAPIRCCSRGFLHQT